MPPKLPPPFTTPVQTRNANKQAHPGAVHKSLDTPRRSSAQVKADRAKEATKKKAAEDKQKLALANSAQIEDKQQQEDDNRKTSSSKPKPEVPSFRPVAHNLTAKAMQNQPESVADAEMLEARPVRGVAQRSALIDEGIESNDSDKDQYQPEDPGFESEDTDEEVTGIIDLEDEDNDGTAKPKKTKNSKPGRADVRAARKTVPTAASVAPPQVSVHGPPPSKKPKKSNDPPSGLFKDWDQPARTESKSTGNKKPEPGPSANSNGIEDDSMVRYGGLVGDDDDDSAERSVTMAGKSGSAKRPNLVKISLTKLAPTSKKDARGGANKWTLADLPEGTSSAFSDILVPLAKLKAGSKAPWLGLETSEVQALVDELFEKHYKVEEGGVWSDLIGYRLSNWRNAFATAAIAGIKMYLDETAAEYFPTTADKAKWVDDNLKAFGDPPTYPFHWKIFVADEDDVARKRGCFQNPFIMYTLAHAHLVEYGDVPNARNLDEGDHPIGALILSLQAVEHALKCWKAKYEGESKPQFSADNYADYSKRDTVTTTKKSSKKVTVRIRRATQFVPTIKRFDGDHWAAIFEAAADHLGKGKKRKRSQSASSRGSEAPDEEVEEANDYVMESDASADVEAEDK